MSDMNPRRGARQSGRHEISPGAALPSATAPTNVPQASNAPQAVSSPPGADAEPPPQVVSTFAEPLTDSVDDSWRVFAEAQAVLARGFEELAVEVTGMTRWGIAATADAAVALLGARTFSEAVEINAALARRGVDTLIEGSAKLSEIGVKSMSEASRPILSRLGGTWRGMAWATDPRPV